MSAVALKILITGPQGSGKSTQSELLAAYLNVPLIGTGELLRKLAEVPDDLGKKIKEELEKGELVDDEIVAEIVKTSITKDDALSGFIMDGYPRSLSQLKLFDPNFGRLLQSA